MGGGGGKSGKDAGVLMFPMEFKQTCPAISPCGGDPLGKWTYSAACFSLSAFDAGCSGVTYDFHGTASGTLEFTASSVSQNVSWAVAGTVLVPKACAPIQYAQCAQITKGVTDLGLHTPGCTAQGSNCTCPVSFDGGSLASSDAGPSDTTFRLSDSTGATTTYEYCIQNSSLSFHQVPAANQTDSSAFTLQH